jgi:hypothetical protein
MPNYRSIAGHIAFTELTFAAAPFLRNSPFLSLSGAILSSARNDPITAAAVSLWVSRIIQPDKREELIAALSGNPFVTKACPRINLATIIQQYNALLTREPARANALLFATESVLHDDFFFERESPAGDQILLLIDQAAQRLGITTELKAVAADRINLNGLPVTATKTEIQKYMLYRGIVAAHGSIDSWNQVLIGNSVILGLRVTSSSLINRGRGEYNDRMIVLWRGVGSRRRAEEFNAFNTEPTAQYDGNQSGNSNVSFRRAEGEDVGGSRIPELGRLADGTYEMLETTHQNPRAARSNVSFRPTPAAVANGTGRIERDSNHDGLFNNQDANRTTNLNDTFKIHSGSMTNTDSAGCQTVHPNDYARFIRSARSVAGQTRWRYVLRTVL